MKGKYKKKLIWCSNCDKDMVEVGTKCKTCGKREYASKKKKPNSNQILKTISFCNCTKMYVYCK